ncbi:hypothetical protein [Terriglobus aquaticus]|uniref:UTRA domain-containing protein n=1 Tax=Terriglobus aquaticus TaxID=940139 RepID=A0ABW9KFF3_9BACT|nr:hypothetical protein [Terriglobus aquaticus]
MSAGFASGARASALSAARTLGRTAALVRLPSPPLAATPGEELGLPSPEFHDISIAPCAVRMRSDGSRELLVAAPTLETALGVSDSDAARQTLASAAFVQVGSDSLLLREVQPLAIRGRAYLYRLFLRETRAEARV